MAVTCLPNGDNSKGEFDTITDLMLDMVGVLLAGVVNLSFPHVKAF